MNIKAFPENCSEFKQLAVAALEFWAPGATVICRALKAGFSGSAVMQVDLSRIRTSHISSGKYILKLNKPTKWTDQDSEIQAHKRAFEYRKEASSFAKDHVVELVGHYESKESTFPGYAMLFTLAGSSLDNYIATDTKECPGFELISDVFTEDLLKAWVDPEPIGTSTPGELLENWLGYRLEPNSCLRQFSSSAIGDNIDCRLGDHSFANPIQFVDFAIRTDLSSHLTFESLLHGDLHGGNVLIHARSPNKHPYWLIDFGLSHIGPAGFDQAYLEVARSIYAFKEMDTKLLPRVLHLVDDVECQELSPPGATKLIDYLRKLRSSVEMWITQSTRSDDLARQFLLARIAAGLNWANKPIDEHSRKIGLYYAGWYADCFVNKYQPIDKFEYWENKSATVRPSNAKDILKEWQGFWEEVKGFNDSTRFILVTGKLNQTKVLPAVGKLPISAVVDLDPYSDEDGLFASCSDVLKQNRKVHACSKAAEVFDPIRATTWIHTCGWKQLNEHPTDLRTWRYQKLPDLRKFFDNFNRATSPDPIVAIVLPGASLDADSPMARISIVCDALAESTLGRAKIVMLDGVIPTLDFDYLPVNLETDVVLTQLASLFGTEASRSIPFVPKKLPDCVVNVDHDIPVVQHELNLEILRSLEENCVVLHSNLLNESPDSASGQFWRGQQPTWLDLHTQADVIRDIHPALLAEVKTRLRKYQNRTIVLEHSPGTGGSTCAYRVAWEVRNTSPVVILRKWSEHLPGRLQRLFAETQLPILLVADASLLTESDREDLYRRLQSLNISVVLLYVRHAFESKADFFLPTSMSPAESERFLETYIKQTTDDLRREQLHQITKFENMAQYRVPFFYGLITYERDFDGIDRYVGNHLSGVRGLTKDVLQYLAITTLYSQLGINDVLVRRLLGVSDESKLSLEDLFGASHRLLTKQGGGIRLVHQLIAEQVLSNTTGTLSQEGWKHELFAIASRFIEDLAKAAGDEPFSVELLLRQIFVERQGAQVESGKEREDFARLIEDLDRFSNHHGNDVLKCLVTNFPTVAHFYNHLGRHQAYRMDKQDMHLAEQYLEEAVRLGGDDFINFHTLGLIRRTRVKSMFFAFKSSADLLKAIEPHFIGAAKAFERTRDLKPDSLYGYITDIQLVLEVSNRLKELSKVESISELRGPEAHWIHENISKAQLLLDDARLLYGTLDQESDYLKECDSDLLHLYNNLEECIRVWEIEFSRNPISASNRLGLAHAYVARRKNSFGGLPKEELRRIVDLVEPNLRSGSRNSEDFRLWFESYRRLPEFDTDKAIANLRVWGARSANWRPSYYEYCIYFYLWFTGRQHSTVAMSNALEESKRRWFGRRNDSVLWYAKEPQGCPFLDSTELGEWDRKVERFWKVTDRLQRVNGVVDVVDGPQAGRLLIDGGIRAFFLPGSDFNVDSNGDPVSFFLGLSPDGGLRAWKVRKGKEGISRSVSPPPRVTMVSTAPTLDLAISRSKRVDSAFEKNCLQYAKDLVTAGIDSNVRLTIDELERRIIALYGERARELIRAIGGFRALLDKAKWFQFDGSGKSGVFVLAPSATRGQRKTLLVSDVVEFGTVNYIKERQGKSYFGYIHNEFGTDNYFKSSSVLGTQAVKKGDVVAFVQKANSTGSEVSDVRVLAPREVKQLIQKVATNFIAQMDGASRIADVIHKIEAAFCLNYEDLSRHIGLQVVQFVKTIDRFRVIGTAPNEMIVLDAPSLTAIPDREIAARFSLAANELLGTVLKWDESVGELMDSKGKTWRFSRVAISPPDFADEIAPQSQVVFRSEDDTDVVTEVRVAKEMA